MKCANASKTRHMHSVRTALAELLEKALDFHNLNHYWRQVVGHDEPRPEENCEY